MLYANTQNKELASNIIFSIEIICLLIAIVIILIGLLQNKKSQTGLSALNGGNEELFSNSKERGIDKTLSVWMMIMGIILFIFALTAMLIHNLVLR